VLRHIKLIIFDLDSVVFDCTLLRLQALRQSLVALADAIPQSMQLPDARDAEHAYRDAGFRWVQALEIGLDAQAMNDLEQACAIHEQRLIEAGAGGVFPEMAGFLAACRHNELSLALGADSGRDRLLAVSDRYQLDSLFQLILCSEEFGQGGSEEMFEEIMQQAEVTASEALVFGTRPLYFQAAQTVDIPSIGCGWGIRDHSGLDGAKLQVSTIPQLLSAMKQMDMQASQDL
jgi:FMN phosphatase YigB (HAD superfamily)